MGLLLCKFFSGCGQLLCHSVCAAARPVRPQLYRFRHPCLAEFHHAGRVRRPVLKAGGKIRLPPVCRGRSPRQRGRAGPVCRRPPTVPPEALCGLLRGHVSVRRGGRPAGAAAQPHFGRAAHPGGAQGPQHEHAALVFRLGADLRGAGHHGPAGGVGRRALAMDRAFVGGAARGRRRAVLPRAAGPQKRRRPAPAAAGAGPQRRVLRAAGGHRAGRRGRGDHGPVGVGLFGKGPAAAKAGGRRVGRVLFLEMLALGRSGYAALGARVPLHRLLIGGSGAAAVLYVVCALAQSPLLGVLACGLTGLCVSLLWPGAIILASRRIPSAGAAMFALLSAGGDVGASLGAFCVGRAADWAQASGTVFAGAAGESGALRAGLLLAAVFPLLCCGVHTALHCSEARAGLPVGSERRRRQ